MPSQDLNRTPTHVFTRELDRLVHQGRLRTYRVAAPFGRRRFRLTWSDGRIEEVEVSMLDSILEALAKGER